MFRGSYSKLGRRGKAGKFFDKNYRIYKKQTNIFNNKKSSSSNIFDNFEHILNTYNNISVSSMISNKSPTGILSQNYV